MHKLMNDSGVYSHTSRVDTPQDTNDLQCQSHCSVWLNTCILRNAEHKEIKGSQIYKTRVIVEMEMMATLTQLNCGQAIVEAKWSGHAVARKTIATHCDLAL